MSEQHRSRLAAAAVTVIFGVAVLAGCSQKVSAPPSTAHSVSVAPISLSQTTTVDAVGRLTIRFVRGAVRPTLGAGEEFSAILVRSAEGTLGGEVHFARAFPLYATAKDQIPDGVFIFAVTPSGLATVVANPLLGHARGERRTFVSGGTLVIYSHFPSDTTALRLASTTEPGSVDNSRTVWLEVPLTEVPVHAVGVPQGGGPF